jgi:DNA-binding NarL/FixJ family response regulator
MTDSLNKIQIVEADHDLAASIAKELVGRGFEVLTSHNGHEGFVSIVKNMPDLVLCDIGIPLMSVLEILQTLSRLAPSIGHAPFVVLAATVDRDVELQARRLGADDFVAKPVDFEILHTIINARLAGIARNQIWRTLTTLTDIEAELLTWAARGKTSAEIAKMLNMPRRKVDFHLDNARVKLGASTRIEATIKAVLGQFIKP